MCEAPGEAERALPRLRDKVTSGKDKRNLHRPLRSCKWFIKTAGAQLPLLCDRDGLEESQIPWKDLNRGTFFVKIKAASPCLKAW